MIDTRAMEACQNVVSTNAQEHISSEAARVATLEQQVQDLTQSW